MKGLFFSILVPLIFLSNYNERTTGYIMIVCDGDPIKPYPLIIFDCFGKFDTTYQGLYVHKFEVSDTLLNNLNKLIHQTEVSADYDLIYPPIGIRAVLNDHDTFFNLGFKTPVSKLFKQITEQFTGQERQNVKLALDQLARRLLIPIAN